MRPTAVVVAFWLAALPAVAQAADRSPPPDAAAPSADASKLPLAAMRHQQPRRDEVDRLEQQRLGSKAQEIRQQQGPKVDRLYEEVMRRSAPGASGQ